MAGAPAAVIVWFRHDLRLDDHPALAYAAATGRPVVPVFVLTDEDGPWAPGGAARWWLHHALAALERDLAGLGLRLVLRRGSEGRTLRALVDETGARTVCFNRRWEPDGRARDQAVTAALRARRVEVRDFPASLLWEPDAVLNRQGGPYQVFTPFWKRLLGETAPARPLPAPARAAAPDAWPKSVPAAALGLLPRPDWAGGLRTAWRPGTAGAAEHWQRFRSGALADYEHGRDRPDRVGTSRLSPHLHFGEISPRAVWHDLAAADGGNEVRRQLVWREFAHHLLHHFPHTATSPLDERFERFPWVGGPQRLRAWQRGRTGYPIVDAGLRELWTTGWMHNRVRMVAASFLVKDLLVPWQEGAAWFWDTLVDADLANNTMGWQWTAGCGADASPFFRVFNPALQGRRFDPDGAYVRRWVPELAGLPDRWLHAPATAPPLVLAAAGVTLGRTYPAPIVDHAEARARTLAAWDRLKGG
ncbi:MAG: deoxyribodipyrimidine photo-lyase [Candidatus Krumholzibacteriia bacterium]